MSGPGCLRTGMCCKRLPTVNAIDMALHRGRWQGTNMTDEFFDGWKTAARAATKNGNVLFTCPFYSDAKGCGLQDQKPKICSNSLSADAFEWRNVVTPDLFFGGKCGWLKGAPRDMVRAVRALERYNGALNSGAPERVRRRLERKKCAAYARLSATYNLLTIRQGRWRATQVPWWRRSYGVLAWIRWRVRRLLLSFTRPQKGGPRDPVQADCN